MLRKYSYIRGCVAAVNWVNVGFPQRSDKKTMVSDIYGGGWWAVVYVVYEGVFNISPLQLSASSLEQMVNLSRRTNCHDVRDKRVNIERKKCDFINKGTNLYARYRVEILWCINSEIRTDFVVVRTVISICAFPHFFESKCQCSETRLNNVDNGTYV